MSQDKVEAGSVAVPINDPEALMDAVRKQIEYYFSKENLQTDKYLNSLMDSNQSVAISEILKFGKIKSLTQEESVVRSSLVKSNLVVIADDRIRSSAKSGRSTLILREIPSTVSEDEIRAIFAYENCKPIVSVRSDVGDTWFVVFDSEEDAKDTLLDLKMKKRCFQGAQVKCRLKTETTVPRSTYFPGPTIAVPVGAGSGAGSPSSIPATSPIFPNGAVPIPYVPGMMMSHGAIPPPFPMNAPLMPMNGAGALPVPPGAGAHLPPKAPDASNQSNATVSGSGGNRGNNRSKGGNSKSAGGKGKGSEGHAQKPTGSKKQIEMNASNFPTLEASPNSSPTQAGSGLSASAAGIKAVGLKFLEAIPVATPGYKGPYKSYTYDEIIAIVKTVQEANLPNEVTEYVKNLPSSTAVFSDSPNLDLLLRQRTFSIDETREQLQQGRPVQREALLSGGIENTVNYGASKKGSGSFSYASVLKTAAAEEPVAAAAPKPAPAAAPKPAAAKPAANASKPANSNSESKPKEGKEKKKKEKNNHAEKDVANATGEVNALSLEDKDATGSAWGGKPSFANVLKLAANSPATTTTPPSPPRATTTKQEEGNARQGNRNRSGSGTNERNRDSFKKSNDSEKANAMAAGSWRRGAKPAEPTDK